MALVVFVGVVSLTRVTGNAAPAEFSANPEPAFVPGEVVVSFKPDGGFRQMSSALGPVDPEDSESVPGLPRTRLVELGGSRDVEAVADRLERRDGVNWAEPNYILQPQALPNDPRLGFLWGLRNVGQNSQLNPGGPPVFGRPGVDIGAPSAWKKTTGSGRNIAVVDTGIDGAHPDLSANLNRKLSRNFVATPSIDPDPVVDSKAWTDQQGHGTHVAGTIGAVGNNGLGVVGVNWRAGLVAVRVCGLDGCTSADIAAGLAYAGRKGIPVANVSLGTEGDETPDEIRVIRKAIADSPDTLFVAAAGNESEDNDQVPSYPCSYKLANVLCVAAIDSRGKMPDFSNYGARSVDLGAPGQDIESTWVNRFDPFEEDYADGIENFDQQPYPWKLGEVDDEPRLTFDGHDGAVPSPVAVASATVKSEVDLSDLSFCRLHYDADIELHGDQTFAVEYRTDGGPARPAPPAIFTAADNTPPDETGEFVADLGGAAGSPETGLSFVYRANGSPTPLPKVQLGYMYVRCHAPMPPGGVYNPLSGTSMATPQVAGVAGLVKSVAPRAGPKKLKRIIMQSVVPTRSLKGKTVSGGRVSAARAVRFIRPATKPRLAGLRIHPRRLKLRPGRSTRVRVRLRNGGGAPAKRLRVCLRAPRRLIRGTGCTRPRKLGSGKRAVFRLRVGPKAGKARASAVRLRFRIRVRGAGDRHRSLRLKILR